MAACAVHTSHACSTPLRPQNSTSLLSSTFRQGLGTRNSVVFRRHTSTARLCSRVRAEAKDTAREEYGSCQDDEGLSFGRREGIVAALAVAASMPFASLSVPQQASAANSSDLASAVLTPPPPGFLVYVDRFNGYSFVYPSAWVEVRMVALVFRRSSCSPLSRHTPPCCLSWQYRVVKFRCLHGRLPFSHQPGDCSWTLL